MVRMWSFLALIAVSASLPAGATTYLVRPDGSGDFPTIQAAVDGTAAGDVIELADGTFQGAGNRDVSYHGKAVTIRSQSGIAWRCVIDCQGSTSAAHRAFLFTSGEGPGSVLDGVTITHGYKIWGGGISVTGSNASPRIRNCIFTDNISPDSEGGGLCIQSDATPLVSGCVFTGNRAWGGGGLSITNGMGMQGPIVTGCTFYGNEASEEGGGVRL